MIFIGCNQAGSNKDFQRISCLEYDQTVFPCLALSENVFKVTNLDSGGTCTAVTAGLGEYFTAGHCLIKESIKTAFQIDGFINGHSTSLEIKTINFHGEFDPFFIKQPNVDLAFFTVSPELRNVNPISSHLPQINQEAFAIGFGTENFPAVIPLYIDEVTDKIFKTKESFSSACPGDSGAPVFQKVEGVWAIVGILTSGEGKNCGDEDRSAGAPIFSSGPRSIKYTANLYNCLN